MDILANNSRKSNGLLLAKDHQNNLSVGVRGGQSTTVISNKYKRQQNNNPVSKSLKSFFKKLRGTNAVSTANHVTVSNASTITENNVINATSKALLLTPNNDNFNSSYSKLAVNNRSKNSRKSMIVTTNLSLYSQMEQEQKKQQQQQENQQHVDNRRCPPIKKYAAGHRHTMDFTNILAIETHNTDSGVAILNNAIENSRRKRAISFCQESIYNNVPFTVGADYPPSPVSSNNSNTISEDYDLENATHATTDTTAASNNLIKNDHEVSVAPLTKVEEDEVLQKQLWDEDPALCPKEEIAQWLGSPSSANRSRILYLYMTNFNFAGQTLDAAFRTLCAKLYLKGESQQLDRIVEAFAKRYYECNPSTTVLNCVDVVYAIAYAILLLNTDLHVAAASSDWSGKKMTKSSFVKNTMETVRAIVFPQLRQLNEEPPTSATTLSSNGTSSPTTPSSLQQYGKRRASSSADSYQMKRNDSMDDACTTYSSSMSSTTGSVMNPAGISRTQKIWLTEIESLLKETYVSVKSNRIDRSESIPLSSTSSSLTRSRTLPRNDQRQSFRRLRRQSIIDTVTAVTSTAAAKQPDVTQANILSSSSCVPKELKGGLVKRKHMMESTDKRARNRQWQLCYLVLSESEIAMCKPQQYQEEQTEDGSGFVRRSRRRKSATTLWNPLATLQEIVMQQESDNTIGWQADEEHLPLATVDLHHSHTTAIPPPGWNPQRPHVFRVETADGGLWLFETVDMFAVQSWVETLNSTAALISKGTMAGGAVSNIDYGWGANWNDTTKEFSADAPTWNPPFPCMIKSNYELNEQYEHVQSQIMLFNQLLNNHRELKMSVDKKLAASRGYNTSSNSIQALNNWDRKREYLLHEITKLECYKDILKSKVEYYGV